jgi:hypothetical protein
LLSCQSFAQKTVWTTSLLEVAAQALPVSVPRIVAPLVGAVKATVGAAWATIGMAPQSASAAAIGVFRRLINFSLLS